MPHTSTGTLERSAACAPRHTVACLAAAAVMALTAVPRASAQPCFAWNSGFGPPPGALGLDGTVRAMTIFDEDGWGPGLPSLFVGGTFTTAGGVTVSGLARWDGTAWHDVGGGVTGDSASVYALAVVDLDGDWKTPALLYVGGDFTTAGAIPAANIACWNGSTWSELGLGTAGNFGLVRALAAFPTDPTGARLYAGGDFTSAGGVTLNYIARWNGKTWSALDSTVGTSGGVFALQPFDDGSGPALFVGGAFFSAGTAPMSNTSKIARWSGTAWSSLGTGLNADVHALAIWDSDGPGPTTPVLAAGGAFTSTVGGGTVMNRVGTWNGVAWSPLGGGLGTSGAVRCLRAFDDQCGRTLYAGGDFFTSGGVSYVGRWSNSTWQSLGLGTISVVRALQPFAHAQGTRIALYAGGDFTAAGGISSSRIAQWLGADADGDGLYDCWEAAGQGIDINCDGTIDFALADHDALVNRKDIFVEIDSMAGFTLTDAALQDVIDAFDVAPVTAPGTLPGIALHPEKDDTDIAYAIWTGGMGGAWPPLFDSSKATRFGTSDERTGANAANRLAAKRLAYHYCIVAERFHRQNWSGIAEVGGNDLLVTLGASGGTQDQQAGTFMHELGHNLGLWHGGHQVDPANDDRFNYKPNYHSVMNYTWQFPMPGYAASWVLDYSNDDRDDLNENSISENTGLDGETGRFVPVHRVVFMPPFNAPVKERGPIKLNDDNDTSDTLVLDINHLDDTGGTLGDTLEGHDDWPALDYNFRDSTDFADGVHLSANPLREMDDHARALLLAIPAPEPCPADIATPLNGAVDTDDLIVLIGWWGVCTSCAACTADIAQPVNCAVDTDDLILLIGSWGPCP